jgi:hypothetical protein
VVTSYPPRYQYRGELGAPARLVHAARRASELAGD